MAMKPDFDVWSNWKRHMNMDSTEVLSARSKYSEMLAAMIESGDTFTKAKFTWNGRMWELARNILREVKEGSTLGYDVKRPLNPAPSRDELSFGTLLSENSIKSLLNSAEKSIYRCSNCHYWQQSPSGKEIKCLLCHSEMREE